MFAPVRGARIVLFDDLGVRADMTASWLAQMAWEVFVLDGLPDGGWATTAPNKPGATAAADVLSPAELGVRLEVGGATLIDLAPSPAYRRGHIPGAAFAIRSRLAEALAAIATDAEIILTCPDGRLAAVAAPETAALARRPVRVLDGGTEAWTAAGRPLQAGDGRPLNPFEDVYRRPYEGVDNPAEAMQAYLDWEFGLVAQLERDGSHGFFVI